MSQDIAEMVIQEQLQQIIINIMDQVRMFYDSVVNNNQNVFQVYNKVNGIKNNIENLKSRLSEYIIKVSEGLLMKDFYIDILKNLEKISQNIDAAVYRLGILKQRFSEIEDMLLSLIKSIIEKIINALEYFLHSLKILITNPKISAENARNILKIEEEVDELYRSFELKIFENRKNDLVYIMLMKDVADRLEDIADLLRSCADNIFYLVFQKI
jgi:uncharacterized protein Yka (UPF0111/DUF47 family)